MPTIKMASMRSVVDKVRVLDWLMYVILTRQCKAEIERRDNHNDIKDSQDQNNRTGGMKVDEGEGTVIGGGEQTIYSKQED